MEFYHYVNFNHEPSSTPRLAKILANKVAYWMVLDFLLVDNSCLSMCNGFFSHDSTV